MGFWILVGVLFLIFGVPTILDAFEKGYSFHLFRLEDIKNGKVQVVPKHTFFFVLQGQKKEVGARYEVVRTDGSIVVLQMVFWPYPSRKLVWLWQVAEVKRVS